MRTLLLISATAMLSGCLSVWNPREQIDTGTDQRAWFMDRDGDGWGDPTVPYIVDTTGSDQYTARNGRDCDDGYDGAPTDVLAAAAEITGRTGSICPANLVTVAAGQEVEVRGARGDTSEFVVVGGATPPVWAAAATAACGPWGWGGGLATFDGDAELGLVKAQVTESEWAGWIGIEPDGSGWKWSPPGGDLDLGTFIWCGGSPPEPESEHDRVALVRSGSEWCLGRPDYLEGYDRLHARFVCERAKPDPEAYAAPLPEEEQ